MAFDRLGLSSGEAARRIASASNSRTHLQIAEMKKPGGGLEPHRARRSCSGWSRSGSAFNVRALLVFLLAGIAHFHSEHVILPALCYERDGSEVFLATWPNQEDGASGYA